MELPNHRVNDRGELVRDLTTQLARNNVIVVVGAGVSVGATEQAEASSWLGLLRSGVTWIETVYPANVSPDWCAALRHKIDSGDVAQLLDAAESITATLGGPQDGEYGKWLEETVGALRPRNDDVLSALSRLQAPLTTTNYDLLIEKVAGRIPVTWQNVAGMQRVLSGNDDSVLHFHGQWREPTSVVLGVTSYDVILGNAAAQHLQQAAGSLKSFLFVGFGSGLSDPNFGSLLSWLATALATSTNRHFRLCTTGERAVLVEQGNAVHGVHPVAYGDRHDDLAPFLTSLAPTAFVPPTAGDSDWQATLVVGAGYQRTITLHHTGVEYGLDFRYRLVVARVTIDRGQTFRVDTTGGPPPDGLRFEIGESLGRVHFTVNNLRGVLTTFSVTIDGRQVYSDTNKLFGRH